MNKNLRKKLKILGVLFLCFIFLNVYADLYTPSLQAGANVRIVIDNNNFMSAQEHNLGDTDAFVQMNVPNLGLMQAGATAHSYNELGEWRSYPSIPDDWPQHVNPYGDRLTFSVGVNHKPLLPIS